VPVGAATAAIFGIPEAAKHLNLATIAAGAGLALLLPVLPYALEMMALRKMTLTGGCRFSCRERRSPESRSSRRMEGLRPGT
jgi:hypothetical protein